jgi:hypothetical protein
MLRPLLICATISLCLNATLVYAQRGRESARPNNNEREKQNSSSEREKQGGNEREKQGASTAPGGEWGERTHSGSQMNAMPNEQHNEAGAAGAAAEKNKQPQASGKQGVAAGAAVANNQKPQASGAQGAAAGAAAVNRNSPQYSGAQGAAAGAAVANRNSPQYSGAQGAAAGAAVANRNQPQYSGAQGAALGAAAANQNNSQYSGAQGAALGAAAANQNNNNSQLSGAQSAALGATAVNQSAPGMAAVGATPGVNTPAAGTAAIRSSFGTTNLHGAAWYGNNPTAWAPQGWSADSAWRQPTWANVTDVCGYGTVAPFSYNYGVNIVSQNGNVVANGQNVGTVAEYSQQAFDIANTGVAAQPAATDQWLPLGVFAMVRNEQQQPHLILQFAINRQGILRGNYTDDVSGTTLPIRGAVDQPSQRAAWTVGDNKQTVMEAGISDFTGSEVPALVHKNGKTDHWLLVRLGQPKQ